MNYENAQAVVLVNLFPRDAAVWRVDVKKCIPSSRASKQSTESSSYVSSPPPKKLRFRTLLLWTRLKNHLMRAWKPLSHIWKVLQSLSVSTASFSTLSLGFAQFWGSWKCSWKLNVIKENVCSFDTVQSFNCIFYLKYLLVQTRMDRLAQTSVCVGVK